MTRPLTRSLVDVDGEKNTNYRPCTYWASNYRPTAGAVWGDPASRRNLVCLVCFGETLRREICLFVIIMFVVCRGSDDVVTCGLANDFISFVFSSFFLFFSLFIREVGPRCRPRPNQRRRRWQQQRRRPSEQTIVRPVSDPISNNASELNPSS